MSEETLKPEELVDFDDGDTFPDDEKVKMEWFPMFYKRWLHSEKVRDMTYADKGLYITLLCLIADSPDRMLPADPRKLVTHFPKLDIRTLKGWLQRHSDLLEPCDAKGYLLEPSVNIPETSSNFTGIKREVGSIFGGLLETPWNFTVPKLVKFWNLLRNSPTVKRQKRVDRKRRVVEVDASSTPITEISNQNESVVINEEIQ
jgi:hypothetical protein